MDPKLSATDPKLQEAYDRVMNGPAIPPPGAVPPPPAPAPFNPVIGAQPPAPAQFQPQAPVMPAEATAPQPAPVSPAAPSPIGGTIAFNANNPGKNQGATVKRGGSKIMSLVLGLGVIVLLVAYTFVWIYVFKLQIPFLPKF